jgi:hypothetical protein
VGRDDRIELVRNSVDILTVHDVTIAEHTHDRALLQRIVGHPSTPDIWRRRASSLLAR